MLDSNKNYVLKNDIKEIVWDKDNINGRETGNILVPAGAKVISSRSINVSNPDLYKHFDFVVLFEEFGEFCVKESELCQMT